MKRRLQTKTQEVHQRHIGETQATDEVVSRARQRRGDRTNQLQGPREKKGTYYKKPR